MFCQKCKTPLHLDSSLEDVSQAAINLLSDASTGPEELDPSLIQHDRPLYTEERRRQYDEAAQNSGSPTFKRSWPPRKNDASEMASPRASRDPGTSYIMLTESQISGPVTDDSGASGATGAAPGGSAAHNEISLSSEMEKSSRLFDILSSRSDIDHPICVECTDALLEGLEKRMASAVRERDAYVKFLRQARADVPTEEELQATRKELEAVEKEHEAALSELEALEAEKAVLEEESAALDLEALQLDKEEEAFWAGRNAFARKLAALHEERDSLDERYAHDSRLLERLQRTNVYNDTFSISHDNHFGTINGLRLGRLSHINVDWPEINAAWGQACLLLATVAEKLNYQFQGYKLNPLGSNSTIDKFELPQRGQASKTASTTNLPLYHTSDIPLNIGFLHRNFDNAMVAFLECIRQLGDHVERTTQGTTAGGEMGLKLPYQIKKDRIHECSIKLSFGGEETWTKACKFTLTCCKFLLAHASNISSARKSST